MHRSVTRTQIPKVEMPYSNLLPVNTVKTLLKITYLFNIQIFRQCLIFHKRNVNSYLSTSALPEGIYQIFDKT